MGLEPRLRLGISRFLLPETRRKIVHTRINGYDLLVIANEDVGRSIHFGRSYEPAESAFLSKAIRAEDICVDIGANVGYYTMLMAQAAGIGEVHAFEPIALNASLVRSSVELNGFINVRVNQCAVGDHTGTTSFIQSVDSAYSSIHDTQRKPVARSTTVPVVTLDDYIGHEAIDHIDVVKADVEGAEVLVLPGMQQLLADTNRAPRLIMLELVELNLQAFGSSVGQLVGTMQDFGYQPFIVSASGKPFPFTERMKDRYYNVYFSRALPCNT